jgi:hypothetical protein
MSILLLPPSAEFQNSCDFHEWRLSEHKDIFLHISGNNSCLRETDTYLVKSNEQRYDLRLFTLR